MIYITRQKERGRRIVSVYRKEVAHGEELVTERDEREMWTRRVSCPCALHRIA